MAAPQRPTDHVRPLPASVVGRGTTDGDPNPHLTGDVTWVFDDEYDGDIQIVTDANGNEEWL